ncbi:unnamed protein product (macronuclear) [Paramecium tetraurelia]|uniref:Transmembrane protein n=1 Tax=Paramecium tetraurelia TaxID=5888 RepID=A0CW63_PARTE|nr:uncharacterized protein GSPATT00001232001 [Paramecium tetraurelia]CAK75030.1 unnamed protein product [Paramecium tetraurelia]|eukprot:XP_001442427.1 hypothetical protein (macronuclear) [Paramecium tetraurelia strain d4-2]
MTFQYQHHILEEIFVAITGKVIISIIFENFMNSNLFETTYLLIYWIDSEYVINSNFKSLFWIKINLPLTLNPNRLIYLQFNFVLYLAIFQEFLIFLLMSFQIFLLNLKFQIYFISIFFLIIFLFAQFIHFFSFLFSHYIRVSLSKLFFPPFNIQIIQFAKIIQHTTCIILYK